jgi:hypothetical protein
MPTNTSRLALTQPAGNDPPVELRIAIAGNATTLDNAAIFLKGTLILRPAAASTAQGTLYFSTDTLALSWNNGSAWIDLVQYASGDSLTIPGSLTVDGTATVDGTLVAQGFLAANRYEGNSGSSGGVALTDNNGHTITMVWTGGTLQFYVDGSPVSVS